MSSETDPVARSLRLLRWLSDVLVTPIFIDGDCMSYVPDFEAFQRLAQANPTAVMIPVFRRLLSDTLTPMTAFCRIQAGDFAFLFESVVGGERVGRYSFLGANPYRTLEAFGTHVTTRDLLTGETVTRESSDPLAVLEAELARSQAIHLPELPRFSGGAVGYAGYDTVRYVEHLPNAPTDDRQLPDLSFAFYDRMVIFDHIQKTIRAVVHADVRSGDLRAAYDAACQRVDELCGQLQSPNEQLRLTDVDLSTPPREPDSSNFTREKFESAVRKCQEYIRAGDIFQVVISQRWALKSAATPLEIYRALRVVNPSPFMFFLKTPAGHLVGSSPEIMVRAEDGEITIRPLAGTRKRGLTDAEDRELEAELLADEKERAEHVMLVDLARNDVGRVAQYGSVVLNDVMKVERYSHVMHITSNVYGKLQPGKTALDALRAGLPAGTVSGAPKVRAMQIIDELEPHRRGPYAGAVGYIDFTGNMDTCIALRTLVIQGEKVYVQAGAGIVADSVPAAEYEETQNKARGILKAIAVAETQFSSRRNFLDCQKNTIESE